VTVLVMDRKHAGGWNGCNLLDRMVTQRVENLVCKFWEWERVVGRVVVGKEKESLWWGKLKFTIGWRQR
jgi:hypothetical protein